MLGSVRIDATDTADVRAFEQLRQKTLDLYGERVDAVVNVAYGASAGGDVTAEAVAVRFLSATQNPLPATPQTLE